MNKLLTIRLFTLLLILLIYKTGLISQTPLREWNYNSSSNHFIEMIPSKGIIIYDDSILIKANRLNDIKKFLNKNYIKYSLYFYKPNVLCVGISDSPPPGYSGKWHHSIAIPVTDYAATLKVDSITFYFCYSSSGQKDNCFDSIEDSLYLNSIQIIGLLNAGINKNLKIGDSFEKIFNYFEKPKNDYHLNMIRNEYKYNGVIFKLDLDSLHYETFKKIIAIEVNQLN